MIMLTMIIMTKQQKYQKAGVLLIGSNVADRVAVRPAGKSIIGLSRGFLFLHRPSNSDSFCKQPDK